MRATQQTMIGTALTLTIAGYAFDAYALSHKIANIEYVRSGIEQDAGVAQSLPAAQMAAKSVDTDDQFGGAFG